MVPVHKAQPPPPPPANIFIPFPVKLLLIPFVPNVELTVLPLPPPIPPLPTHIVYLAIGSIKLLISITSPPPPLAALPPPPPPPPTIKISQVKASVVVKVYCVCPVNPTLSLV